MIPNPLFTGTFFQESVTGKQPFRKGLLSGGLSVKKMRLKDETHLLSKFPESPDLHRSISTTRKEIAIRKTSKNKGNRTNTYRTSLKKALESYIELLKAGKISEAHAVASSSFGMLTQPKLYGLAAETHPAKSHLNTLLLATHLLHASGNAKAAKTAAEAYAYFRKKYQKQHPDLHIESLQEMSISPNPKSRGLYQYREPEPKVTHADIQGAGRTSVKTRAATRSRVADDKGDADDMLIAKERAVKQLSAAGKINHKDAVLLKAHHEIQRNIATAPHLVAHHTRMISMYSHMLEKFKELGAKKDRAQTPESAASESKIQEVTEAWNKEFESLVKSGKSEDEAALLASSRITE